MKSNSPKATLYLSPPIVHALQAVPTQSLSGRLGDICDRYMRMVEDELARTQFKMGEREAIRRQLAYLDQLGDEWAIGHVEALARFPVAIRVAILEQFDREQAQDQAQFEGDAK